ncbi:MAG TPA: hypothetical protein VIV11_21625 [Kofleriaceae bacterium]
MLLSRVALLVVLAGCPLYEQTLPECNVLDTSSVMLVAADLDGNMIDISDGTQIPLIGAPQGGHILLVGASVRASSDCQLIATAALRDTATNRVIGLEQRPLLLERHSNGWAKPRDGLDAMPNVAVCPSAAATSSIFDHEYKLEVSLTTLDGAPILETSAMVTPTCPAGDMYCQNDCGAI